MQSQPPVRQKIIREIKPSPVLQARTKNHKLRVAAYCRVSTEQEEQQTSIENQITYYEDLIRSNPEWEYAGVFSDDGISGTRDENRPGFMEMIKQCKKGKIDMILAKSLSRFSRNTVIVSGGRLMYSFINDKFYPIRSAIYRPAATPARQHSILNII